MVDGTTPLSSGFRRAGGAVRHVARRLLDLVLPPRCLACGVDVAEPGALCASCWAGIDFIAPPLCQRCGRPFEIAAGDSAICGACVARPPGWGRCRAALVYDDASRGPILAFKHGDRTDFAAAFAGWMARAGPELLADADLIVPVPLHYRRLVARRYNQSALLAQGLARRTGLPVSVDLLVRRRATRSQGGLSRDGRARNVAGVFAVRTHRRDLVRDRRVLLVDDVLTTGATLEECVKVLRRAGAAKVDVLTLARVVRGESLE